MGSPARQADTDRLQNEVMVLQLYNSGTFSCCEALEPQFF